MQKRPARKRMRANEFASQDASREPRSVLLGQHQSNNAPGLKLELFRVALLSLAAVVPGEVLKLFAGTQGVVLYGVGYIAGFALPAVVCLILMIQHDPRQLDEQHWRALSLFTSFTFWSWAIAFGHSVSIVSGRLEPLLLAVFFAPYVTVSYCARRAVLDEQPQPDRRRPASDFAERYRQATNSRETELEPTTYTIHQLIFGSFSR